MEEKDKALDGKESEIESVDLLHLYEELEEKQKTIQSYETKLKKIYEDFNYNLQLIYDRDKEIEELHLKIEKLSETLNQKDLEIMNLHKQSQKVKNLEQEKIFLTKRIEQLLNTSKYEPSSVRKSTPYLEKQKISRCSNQPSHKKYFSTDSQTKFTNNESQPLNQLNYELEMRIKSLENENFNKKHNILHNSLTEPSHDHFNIVKTREEVNLKEKEISKLIDSLYKYKQVHNTREKWNSYDNHMDKVDKDINRLKSELSRPISRVNLITQTSDFGRYDPSVKCKSSFDRNRN